MAENNEYTINIKAIIDANSTTAKTGNTNTQSPSEKSASPKKIESYSFQEGLSDSMAVGSKIQHGTRQIQKLSSTFGDDFSQSAQKISKLLSYGVKIGSVASGNYVEIIDLLIDAVCDIANMVKIEEQKQAAIYNEQDLARIQAGLFNIEDTVIKTNGFSGRYQYQGRGGK